MSRRAAVSALSALAVGFAGRARAGKVDDGIDHPQRFELTHTTLEIDGLDEAHDGITIGQLSDVHVGPYTPDGRILAAVDALNAAQPDLVILTGDYVTRKGDPLERVPELLGRLNGDVVAVLGNHDHWTDAYTISRDLERANIPVLKNANLRHRIRGRELAIIGIDDAVSHHDDTALAFRGTENVTTRLVLAHAPPTVDKLPENAGLVCFSGHTHGGQLYLGKVTEAVFRRAGQPYVRGRYDVGGNTLFVNRGLGFGRGSPLPRLGSEPEVALITLRKRRAPQA